MYCPQCGSQIGANRAVIVERNPVGTAGFWFSLLAALLCWVPVLGSVLWIVGAACSIVGIFGRPKGMAVVGLIISFFDVLLTILVFGGLFTAFLFI